MAKKGLNIPANFAAFDRRVIVIDKSGVPWVIEPETGTVTLAKINMPANDGLKLSAVKFKKHK